MIPLMVWPQEQRLGQMLTRVLAVLEEQDMYSLPGDVNRRRSDYHLSWNNTEDEDEDDDDEDDRSRHNGSGDTCRALPAPHANEQPFIYDDQQRQQTPILDGNGNEVPIIVIRPVARRPRQQRRNYMTGMRRPRKHGDEGRKGERAKLAQRSATQCSSQHSLRVSRSRSRSPQSSVHHHQHRHSNSASGARMQNQSDPINN